MSIESLSGRLSLRGSSQFGDRSSEGSASRSNARFYIESDKQNSNRHINEQSPGINRASQTTLASSRGEGRTMGLLIAGIVLLVLSILVLLVGFGLLIPGIVQTTSLLVIVGASLIGTGVLGVLIAGLLIGFSQHRANQSLIEEVDELVDLAEQSREENKNTWAEINNLRKLLFEAQDKVGRKDDQLEDMGQKNSLQLHEKLLLIQELQGLIQRQDQHLRDLLETKRCLLEQVRVLKEKLLSKDEEIQKAESKEKKITDNLICVNEKNKKLEELQGTLKENIKELEESLNMALKANALFKEDNNFFKSELKKLQTVSSEDEVKKQKIKLEGLLQQVRKASSDLSILEQKIHIAENRLQESNEEILKNQTEVRKCSLEIQKQKEQLSQLRIESLLPSRIAQAQQEAEDKMKAAKTREVVLMAREADLEKKRSMLKAREAAVAEKETFKDDE